MMRRLDLLSLIVLAACGTAARPPEAPPPAPPVVPAMVIPSPPVLRVIQLCVVQGGELTLVTAQQNTITGDTLPPRQDWGPIQPSPRAEDAPWFIDHEPIIFQDHRYVKFSTPREVGVDDLEHAAMYRGIALLAEDTVTRPPDILYVPLRNTCLVQPYALESRAYGVRG
jgi:hypothetical protein